MRRRSDFTPVERPAVSRRGGKAFTLVELLIVVSIISLLVGLLVPALDRARELARRAVCGKHLNSIAEAMNMYVTEFEIFPALYLGRGGASIVGAKVNDPNGPLKGNSCNMFILVRRAHIESQAFVCPSSGHKTNPNQKQDADDDFRSYRNLSYSMHVQREEASDNHEWRPLRPASDPGMAVMADRTPISGRAAWVDLGSNTTGPGGEPLGGGDGYQAKPEEVSDADAEGGLDKAQQNSFNHEREGQNVSYRDGHVLWQTSPGAGVDGDNIWTWDNGVEGGSTEGRYPGQLFRDACAAHRKDSFLFP